MIYRSTTTKNLKQNKLTSENERYINVLSYLVHFLVMELRQYTELVKHCKPGTKKTATSQKRYEIQNPNNLKNLGLGSQ